MSDETVPPGEIVLTSGGDSIFPKGLPIGRVSKVSPGSDLFLNIHVRPAADLSRLEEVLVVTKIDERQAQPEQAGGARAIDILAARLPSVPSKPDAVAAKIASPNTAPSGGVATKTPTNGVTAGTPTPGSAATGTAKTTHPVTPDAIVQSKPKAKPPDASNGAPAAGSEPTAESPVRDSSGPPPASKAATLSPTPAKTTPLKTMGDPKPPSESPDSPH